MGQDSQNILSVGGRLSFFLFPEYSVTGILTRLSLKKEIKPLSIREVLI